MRKRIVELALFATLLAASFALSASALAQNAISTGSISGRVTDPSGAAIPGVSIVATNTATGVRISSETNAEGLYSFPLMRVGDYSLTFGRDGFKTTNVESAVVSVGQTSTVNVALEVGTVTQQVTVTATAPLLNPSESTVSTVVNQELIENLPLSGRRYTDFVLLTPNVNADGQFGTVSFGGQQGSGDSGYANGNGSNTFTVDGASFTSSFFGEARGRTRVPYVFGEQSIQEFQVSDNPYSAAYGGAGSGFVNTVTKSGTDQLHGHAFYYNRNSGTGANDAVDKANGQPQPLDVLQQFGADLGGPIVPHKAWFYFDYEQQREKDPISVINPGQASLNETSFGIPAGTLLPSPTGNFPTPSSVSAPDPTNPVYLQQVSDALNTIGSNIGLRARRRDDISFFPKVDWQASDKDHLTFVYNYNRFTSPGGEITFNPVAFAGIQALSNNSVRDHHASIHWEHILRADLFNDFHGSFLRDEQIATPSGLVNPNFPAVEIFSPEFFELGNPSFSLADNREYEWEFDDRVNYVHGRHNLSFGVDYNHDHIVDFFFGNFRGTYAFFNPTDFALGHYGFLTQSAGNPTFRFSVPYYGFYADDKFQVRSGLTLDFGLREDFQVYPQPQGNPAVPLTGQFPNEYRRLAPRFGFAYQPFSKTVVRGGFGIFYNIFDGINYENSVIANGLPSQQASTFVPFNSNLAPNQQNTVFPAVLSNTASFAASSNVSIVDPGFRTPYVLESSLQIEREIAPSTTVSVGTMWTHGVHLISSSAADLNLLPPPGTTTYVLCPAGTFSAPCGGPSIVGPNLDSGLLADGRLNPNVGQINALISPGVNNYNAFFAQVQRRVANGLSTMVSYTFSKNIVSNGVDFNNQFDFANTHAPSLLDQRHRLSVAAVYAPKVSGLSSAALQSALSHWTLSTVMQFNSGRTYAALLNAACTGPDFNTCNGANGNLNDSAFNESTGNTALGINGAGPSPAAGLNSFYGPGIYEVDLGIERRFHITERQAIALKVQAFNLLNHANFFVQNGSGINATQYNPLGPNCGDGATANQTCYLVPNSGPGNFQTLQSVDQLNGPRVFQFALTYSF